MDGGLTNQALKLIESGKQHIYEGKTTEAKDDFISAKTIAEKVKAKNIISLIDLYLKDL